MKPIVIANWKATCQLAKKEEWASHDLGKIDSAEIIICPSFAEIAEFSEIFRSKKVKIGAQDVSRFERGAYTGEVTAEMLKKYVTHCIVGHSERRKHFGEREEDVIQKVEFLLKENIAPILCVSDMQQLDVYSKDRESIINEAESIIFVYEPPGAISGGGAYKPESPEKANDNAGKFKEKIGKNVRVLYGGSINPENVAEFFSQPNIDGGLLGQASQNPKTFFELLSKLKDE